MSSPLAQPMSRKVPSRSMASHTRLRAYSHAAASPPLPDWACGVLAER